MWHMWQIIPRLAEHCHFMPEPLAELDIFGDGPHRAGPAFQPRHKQDLHKGPASERKNSLKLPEHSEIASPVIPASVFETLGQPCCTANLDGGLRVRCEDKMLDGARRLKVGGIEGPSLE